MLLLGHRGCRGAETENTIAAFDRALECGCDGFELDVRQSLDGVPIIWHDARLRGRFLSRQFWMPFRELCAAKSRLRRTPAIELCSLEEVLIRYRQVAWIDIELKVHGLEAQVVELVRRYRPERGFVISSFRRNVLLELHRLDPTLPLGFIFDRVPRPKIWPSLPVQYMKPSARLVTKASVQQFHDAGMKVLTWTVNHTATMRRVAEAGVDGVIGDDPWALIEQAAELHTHTAR
jgi:glycerophosphoryl diester phosphodiesterase